MTLTPGSRLGPYEILAPLGAGGMGEVFRARDTRLGRDVAIKVLAARLASSPEVRQRFEREARTISQLSHPHICALFDVGRHGETDYLVMELLEGETLSDRLARGPLPLAQALRCAVEIADALDRAHRRGVVHRDLKPANAMLTKSGVKLLDFGLAKEAAAPPAGGSLTALPTQQGLTSEGAIVGTFQYMAPEQLEGREADARTDIFAFGALLYEMTTGRKAFSGASQASLISAIMKEDPAPLSTIDPAFPRSLDRLVRTCLAKDPDERWQSAADLKRELVFLREDSPSSAAARTAASGSATAAVARPWLPWSIAATATLLAGGLALRPSPVPPAPRRMELSIVPPERTMQNDFFAISPDGSTLAFSGISAGKSAIRLRRLGSSEVQVLGGTASAESLFWSPDGTSLGFVGRGKLRRIDIATGSIDVLADAEAGRGGTWSPIGEILFARKAAGAIYRVPAGGGEVQEATTLEPGDLMHRWPQFLPDGNHFLYYVKTESRETSGTYLGALGKPGRRLVLRNGATGVYAPTASLLYVQSATLLAQPFDPGTGTLSGSPRPITRPLMRAELGSFIDLFTVSANGVLVYRAGNAVRQLTWFGRNGELLGKVAQPDIIWSVVLSPDDREAAISTRVVETNAYTTSLVDIGRNATTPIAETAAMPVWTADGQAIVYRSEGKKYEVRRRSVHGAPADDPIGVQDSFATPHSIAPDGRTLLYTRMGGNFDIGAQRLEFDERSPHFAPDGRYFVYSSDESGQVEVFVRRFPMTQEVWRVSTSGGQQPDWSRDGKEIFFVSHEGDLMTAPVSTSGGTPAIAPPRRLFRVNVRLSGVANQYAVTADGRRFLVALPTGDYDAEPFRVLLNWSAKPSSPAGPPS
jgi:serine/threonine protein kinase/Tol biopolymer transport system component